MHGLHHAAAFNGHLKPRSVLASIHNNCPAPRVLVAVCLSMVLVLAWAEGYVGKVFHYDFDFTPIYLIPITLISWCKGFPYGIFLSIVASAFASLMTVVGVFDRHGEIWPAIVNAVMDMGTMGVASFMVAEVKYLLTHEQELSRTDHVTGIKNTRSFWETLSSELDRMKRHDRPLTVAYLDVDDFKGVNDQFGHKKGDELLRLVGKVLTGHIRSHDVVARVGGDEFAICFPEADQLASKNIVNRLRTHVDDELKKAGFSNGLSIGVVTFIKAPPNVDTLVHLADEVMYSVKTSGKGKVAFHLAC
jgi:diguanylate cyclase (GGDEF)-like protein